jgi:PAS domain S-box-containing protein
MATQLAPAPAARLVEAAPEALLAVDAVGRIAIANPAAETLFGYEPGALADRAVEELVPERFRLLDELLWARRGASHGRARLEMYGRRADGSELPIELSVAPLRHDREVWTVIAVRDATERTLLLAAEQVARWRAEALAAERAAVLAHVADAVVLVDPGGAPAYLNPAAARLFGLGSPTEPLTGVTFEAPGQPPTALAGLALTRLVLAGDRVDGVELTLRRADGTTADVLASAAPVAADGPTLGAVLTLRDVTARRAFERRRDEFFANVSHDLRTPVAVIRTSLGVVLANAPPDTPAALRRLLGNADLAAARLGALVEDLLELARLQAGRARLRLRPCDLAELARRSARTVEPLAQQRRQRLELVVPADPVPALVDVDRIERALLNLLSNAAKHGREGGLIRMTLHEGEAGLELVVADDGPGVPDAEQDRVFERFYVGGPADARPGGGGLGLPIARAMVELHGGQLTLESAPGAGATFRIRLPVRPTADPEEEVTR